MTAEIIPFRKARAKDRLMQKQAESVGMRPPVARSVDDLWPSAGFTGWGDQRITYPEQEDKD